MSERHEGNENRRPQDWRSEFEPGSEPWYEEQAELIEKMVETVSGVGLDGKPAKIDPAQFSIHRCRWNGIEIPVIMFGVGGEARPMYFFRAYAFHPGSAPKQAATGAQAPMVLSPPRTGRVFVVDTGWRHGDEPAHKKISVIDLDPCTVDSVHGHGPAIVELIERLAGPQAEVHLRQVRFSDTKITDVNGNSAIPIFEHPDSKDLFRGFDEAALLSTLNSVTGELRSGDIVNLSLGTVVCPDMMTTDPVGTWLKNVATKGVKVVVAAGNHGTDVPSWPAAYATGVGSIGEIDNVYSVGAGTTMASKSAFSAHGSWVTTWRAGADVPVNHHDPKYGTDRPNVTWSGTSFAAPICAAELLPKVGRRDRGPGIAKPATPVGRARQAVANAKDKTAPAVQQGKQRIRRQP